jgi:hypothetical protein
MTSIEQGVTPEQLKIFDSFSGATLRETTALLAAGCGALKMHMGPLALRETLAILIAGLDCEINEAAAAAVKPKLRLVAGTEIQSEG